MINRALIVAGAVALGSCAVDDPDLRTYANNELQMAPAYAALNGCYCLFVMNRDMAYCQDLIRVSPEVGRISVDTDKKTVLGIAFVSWTATARFVDEKRGCVLE